MNTYKIIDEAGKSFDFTYTDTKTKSEELTQLNVQVLRNTIQPQILTINNGVSYSVNHYVTTLEDLKKYVKFLDEALATNYASREFIAGENFSQLIQGKSFINMGLYYLLRSSKELTQFIYKPYNIPQLTEVLEATKKNILLLIETAQELGREYVPFYMATEAVSDLKYLVYEQIEKSVNSAKDYKHYCLYKEGEPIDERSLRFYTDENITTRYIKNKLYEFGYPVDDYILLVITMEGDKFIEQKEVRLPFKTGEYDLIAEYYHTDTEMQHVVLSPYDPEKGAEQIAEILERFKDRKLSLLKIQHGNYDYALKEAGAYKPQEHYKSLND